MRSFAAVGATPLATLGGAPGKTLFSPQIKTTATSAVFEEVGANGLKREGGPIPPSRNPSTLVLGRTIDLIIPAGGTGCKPSGLKPVPRTLSSRQGTRILGFANRDGYGCVLGPSL